jgi:uncharacterized repeat protein (TIGR01451 family)
MINYTITVTNAGPNTAQNVTVVDVLPASVEYVSDSDSCVQSPPGTLTCSLGTIANGADSSFDITVNPTQVGNVTNTASVDSDKMM